MSEEGFFSRWARRKNEVRGGRAAGDEPDAPASAPAVPPPSGPAVGAAPAMPGTGADAPAKGDPARPGAPVAAPGAPGAQEQVPLPSMDDVARLTRDSDYSAFMRRGVDEDVKRAAMKKLFTDPHYNVMDGLDIYIDDYSKPDPIPMAMLRKMTQSKMLGLFRDEEQEKARAQGEENAPAVAHATAAAAPTDDSPGQAVAQSRAEEGADASPALAQRPPDAARAAAPDAPPDGATPPAGGAPAPAAGPAPGSTEPARPAGSS